MPLDDIEHFFVLMLENRSFDHMLGYMPRVDGLKNAKPNFPDGMSHPSSWPGGVAVSDSATNSTGFDPGHDFDHVRVQLMGRDPSGALRDYASHPITRPPTIRPQITMAGFIQAHAEAIAGKPGADADLVMRCFNPDKVPVLTQLAEEYAVCDRWFSSVPGPTWPNRFFVHAATSGGLFDGPGKRHMTASYYSRGYRFENGTIFDKLRDRAKIYSGAFFPQSLSLAGIKVLDLGALRNFRRDIDHPDFDKRYVFIEPSYGLVTHGFIGGTSQHPLDSVESGEHLIRWVYEQLRDSRIWNKSALIVTYDEHGGFYDHVAPPACAPPGDTEKYAYQNPSTGIPRAFDFTQLGVRVPAVIVSPFTRRGVVDHTVYDHTSIPATVLPHFWKATLTGRDAGANRFGHLFDLKKPRDEDAPRRLRRPVAARGSPRRPRRARDEPLSLTENAFLDLAKRADVQVSPPIEWPELERQWREIRTVSDAGRYIGEVTRRVRIARAGGLPA